MNQKKEAVSVISRASAGPPGRENFCGAFRWFRDAPPPASFHGVSGAKSEGSGMFAGDAQDMSRRSIHRPGGRGRCGGPGDSNRRPRFDSALLPETETRFSRCFTATGLPA